MPTDDDSSTDVKQHALLLLSEVLQLSSSIEKFLVEVVIFTNKLKFLHSVSFVNVVILC